MSTGNSGSASARPGTVLVANPSADLYGSDRMMLESVRGLVGMGWRVVVTCSTLGPLVEQLVDAGAEIEILPVPVVRKSMMSPRGLIGLATEAIRALPRMSKLMTGVGPDAVLINTVTIPLWLLIARWCRVPSVVHVHEAESSISRMARLGLRAPLILANRVVYNSETSRRVSRIGLLERTGRTRVIHNGVRGPTSITPARAQLDDPFQLLYVGRLSPRKGVDLAVRAISELSQQGICASLELVGSVFPGYEWYETELRELVRDLGLGDKVQFRGFQPDIWPFLAAADIAVVPSRLEESFGNTVIEALSAARPVLVSDLGGLREAAAGFEAAALVTPDDVAALAERLRTVHADWQDCRQAAARDAVRAQERYGTSRFHRALADTLSDVVRRA